MVANFVVGGINKGGILEKPLLDGFGCLGVLGQAKLLSGSIGVFDENARDAVQIPIAIPASSEIGVTDKFVNCAAQLNTGFIFKIDAEVIISKHFNLHINNYDGPLYCEPLGMSTGKIS